MNVLLSHLGKRYPSKGDFYDASLILRNIQTLREAVQAAFLRYL